MKSRQALGLVQKCRNVVIVVDEWQISSGDRSEGTYAFDAYEFDRKFPREMVREDFQRAVIARYLTGLFGNLSSLAYERAVGFNLEDKERQAFLGEQGSVGEIEPAKAAGRALKLYMGSNLQDARRLSRKLADFSQYLMEESGVVEKVIFVFPPLPQAFRDQSPEMAKQYKQESLNALEGGNHSILDLSEIWPEDHHYADEDHLTSEAARALGREMILPHLALN